MVYQGILKKMEVAFSNPITYKLAIDETEITINSLIGSAIQLNASGEIFCLKCGNKTRQSFMQGYCYACFISSPETEECILNPEKCRAHEGIARDMEFAKTHCLQTHYVYLAVSSHVKVGITRKSQIPTRWIDQGASRAIQLAEVPNRFTSGIIEVELKKIMPDKTAWQKMLKNEIDQTINLLDKKNEILSELPNAWQDMAAPDDTVFEFNYPVMKYPNKVKSIDLEKTPSINGKLMGIKGQYLLFDEDRVINIRKYGGYRIEIQT